MHASVWVCKTQARNESDLVGLTCSLGSRRRLSRLCGVRLLCRARACMFGPVSTGSLIISDMRAEFPEYSLNVGFNKRQNERNLVPCSPNGGPGAGRLTAVPSVSPRQPGGNRRH